MTNAEKLAKNTELLAAIISDTSPAFCDICPAREDCVGGCKIHAKAWLESNIMEEEVKEDDC